VIVRRGGAQDIPFMKDMLHHAFYWREGDMETGDLPVKRYVSGWGRPGDAAVIAIDAGNRVGAAWFRLFPREEAGYGFVDETTPELAIAVVPAKRGHGIGRDLLEGLFKQARADGFGKISLSVEEGSPQVGFYERQGFRKAQKIDDSWTMVADL
jgi:GNAT superfamily N-acetyltransferase